MQLIDTTEAKKIELKGNVAEFRQALEEEIEEIKKSGQSSISLNGGRQIESNGSDLWYRFKVEYLPSIPADTPCKLLIGNEQFDVTVISLDEESIIISTKESLPESIEKARLENGSTVLMERLITCIEEDSNRVNTFGNFMLPSGDEVYLAKKVYSYDDLELSEKNTESQNNAIKAALTNDITYIWGPPGTGKTTVIGEIIDKLYKYNRSVLVVSHTNTAVDGAIEKIDKIYSKNNQDSNENYPILRIGIPTRPLSKNVLLDSHIEVLGKELFDQKKTLEEKQKDIKDRLIEITTLIQKDNWIKESKLDEISQTIKRISDYENEIERIQNEMDIISQSIQQEKDANPEYSQYLSLCKKINKKQKEFDSISNLIYETENMIDKINTDIQNSIEEIEKHRKHAELIEEESNYPHIDHLQNQLSETRNKISDLNAEIESLKLKKINAHQVILDYEKKNSLVKMFSDKTIVINAKSMLSDISNHLPQAEDKLKNKYNLEQEYKHELEKLNFIRKQISIVVPSRTQTYWKTHLEQLQKKLSNTFNLLSNFTNQSDELLEELEELKMSTNEAKVHNDIILNLSRELNRIQKSIADINFKKSSEHNKYIKAIEGEWNLCNQFLHIDTKGTNQIIFEELDKLLNITKSEIEHIDMIEINKEKREKEKGLEEVSKQISDVILKIQELEKQVVMSAKIVGATLTKSYLSKALRERTFNTIILDEASMASIPALWCVSYLVEKSIIIVGDFLQLPPIVISEKPTARKWLGKDIFYHSGMQERAKDQNGCPNNFVMLNDQFRMESDIAEIANMYYGSYGGLKSHDNTKGRKNERNAFYEWFSGEKTNQNIHLIDTESLHAWVTGVPQGKKHSRLNCFSAAVDVDLAFKFLEKKFESLDPKTAKPVQESNVLIVAPYKPHILHINKLIEMEYKNRGFEENLNFIRAGTIHSLQGSEADIVIFDLVIDNPHWKANLFMTDTEINDNLRKMFNVAIARSKFKLYIVGNFSYCQKKAKNNALGELLDKLINKEKLIKEDAKKLLPEITFNRQENFAIDEIILGKNIVCRENSFNDYFMKDISSFEERLIVYSPFITESRLSKLLPSFVDAISEEKKIVVVTKTLSERRKSELSQYKNCEKQLLDIGVSIIHKKGMHEKLIFVDSKAIWIGSLNALSFTGTTGEVMQRYENEYLTAEYEKLFDIEHIHSTILKPYEQKCPFCKGELMIGESPKGGIYWKCNDCDYSRNTKQQYPVGDILNCHKCGAPYVFDIKKDPKWVCSKNPKHFQPIRERDLKLEKMVALIPPKEQAKVDKFFLQKQKTNKPKKQNKLPKSHDKGKSKNDLIKSGQIGIFDI